jgi:branched-chain amino acid transport system ATP-binding protein
MASPAAVNAARPAAPPPMLSVHQLSAWWGPAQALFEVSLHVGSGELVVLQGLNGAGKSTLLQAIMAAGPRSTVVCSYEKNSVQTVLQNAHTGLPSHQRARLGLGYVPEDRRLFAALTVRENLHIACQASAPERAARESRALDLFPALKTMLSRPAAHMSGGEQQMLSIARTLMTGPSLLLLDEPCEGIAPVLVEHLRDALLALKAQGMPMLVAEQNHILADRADRVLRLVAGRLEGILTAGAHHGAAQGAGHEQSIYQRV